MTRYAEHLSIHSVYKPPSTTHIILAAWTSPGAVLFGTVLVGMVGGVAVAQALEWLRGRR